MRKLVSIACLLVSTELLAASPLLDKTRTDIYKAMQEVRSASHVDCASDVEKYQTPLSKLQGLYSQYSGNYYLMKGAQGNAAVRMLGQGMALVRLEAADKLLTNGCYAEAKEFYREVIKSTSDVSLQNRAMLGLEDVRDKTE